MRRLGAMAVVGALAVSCPAVLFPAVARAEGVPVAQATEEQKTTAQDLFTKALDKSKAGDHAGALQDFRASYDVVASPNTRLMIVRELDASGNYAEAYQEAVATEAVAREAAAKDPKYEDALKSASEEKTRIAAKVGFVAINLGGKTGELVVGGRSIPVGDRAAPIPVTPGLVEVTLRGPSGVLDTQTVTVAPGAEVAVSFAPPKPIEKPKPPPTSGGMHPFDMGDGQRITGFVFAGVGVVGFALFAGFGAANQSIYSDLEDQCPNGNCPPSLEGDAEDGRTFQTAANASLIIGAVGLAAGAAFLIPTFVVSKSDKAALQLDLSPTYAGLRGSFQ